MCMCYKLFASQCPTSTHLCLGDSEANKNYKVEGERCINMQGNGHACNYSTQLQVLLSACSYLLVFRSHQLKCQDISLEKNTFIGHETSLMMASLSPMMATLMMTSLIISVASTSFWIPIPICAQSKLLER